MSDLKFAVIGAGFWAHYQTAAWTEDNLKTMRLVYSAYESAERNQVINFDFEEEPMM
jgi:hypothetical protein